MKLKLLLITAIFLSLFLSLSYPPKAYASSCAFEGGKVDYNVGDFIIFYGTIDSSFLTIPPQEYHLAAISQTDNSRTQIGSNFTTDVTFFSEARQIPSLPTAFYTIAFEQKFGGDMSICGSVTIHGTPPPTPCGAGTCTTWAIGGCGGGANPCALGQMLETRDCIDAACGESRCVANPFCGGAPPPPPPPVGPPPPPPPPPVGPPPPPPPPPVGPPQPADLLRGAPTISLPGLPAGSKITTSAGLPSQIISGFLGPIIVILGFLTVFYIIFAGIKFIISRGNPEAVAEARNRLIYAVVGFIILLLSYVALQIVDTYFLGSKVA